jgi:HD-GYP domain-containing protein (c-di-GMP phosphodiesterase class II)
LLIVPLEEAKPGMALAMTVTHPEHPEQDLLRRGFILDQPVISRMHMLGIGCIFVDYPGLDDLDKFLAPNLSAERQVLYSKVKSTFTECQRETNPTVDFGDYYSSTRDFITTLLSNGRNPIYLDELSTSLGNDGVRHSMAVAHLALVMGIKLERYLIDQRHRLTTAQAREVVNLGVAGMLHDLGKSSLPASLQKLHALCPPAEDEPRAEWEAHTRLGYAMIREEVEPTAAAAVLHHHQHFDGSGFPRRDAGNGLMVGSDGCRIHVFSRILQAADLYDRLTLADDGKSRRSNIEILYLMRTRYAGRVDPQIMQVLPTVVPPFPPGSRVILSDGQRAVVTAIDPEDPFRPTVRTLGADNWTISNQTIVLMNAPELSVARAGNVQVAEMIPQRPTARLKCARASTAA